MLGHGREMLIVDSSIYVTAAGRFRWEGRIPRFNENEEMRKAWEKGGGGGGETACSPKGLFGTANGAQESCDSHSGVGTIARAGPS